MARRKTVIPKHLYLNRDESWLRFDLRVLGEAQDAENPLLERLRFLSITASNLDEFIEIRVAGILQRIEDGYVAPNEEMDDGLTEQQRLDLLADHVHAFVHAQYNCWTQQILPALASEKIRILSWADLNGHDREHALHFYAAEVDPLLTPVTIDPSHPFPRVLNKALCIAFLLRRKSGGAKKSVLGIVTVPRSLPRFVRLPSPAGEYRFVYLHEILEAQAERMFPGYLILAHSPFRITRNSNLYLEEEESRTLLESVRAELHNRRKGDVVRLEVERGSDESLIEQLRTNFELYRWQVFRMDAPVNLTRIADLYPEIQRADLKFPAFSSREYALAPTSQDIFAEMRQRDILLHHPFDSFKTVEKLLQSASEDECVVTMKQTLYRTSKDSSLFQSLVDAAETKDVTVVVELMARFDEASNIRWARSLEEAGVQVFHGIVGRKTHCKLALLVRRDEDGVIRRYAHLGTGNYNPVTARFYTDISLLTAKPEITAAVHRVFNYLTSSAEEENFRPLLVAPLTLAQDLLKLIDRETQHARSKRPARIIAKMNGLLDRKLVDALYRASQAGVKINLIVRGMCALRPGVPGLSENIEVRSIVGRFLEHSRIFWFANAGKEEIFCGSADWMPRNLYERCETVFPITDNNAKRRLRDQVLEAYLRDTQKVHLLQNDGQYLRPKRTGTPFSAQEFLMTGSPTQPSKKPKKTAAKKKPLLSSKKKSTRSR
jgi:polyphosphate kinase